MLSNASKLRGEERGASGVTFTADARDMEFCAEWLLSHSLKGKRLLSRVTVISIASVIILAGVAAFWSPAISVGILLLSGLTVAIRGKGSPKAMFAEVLRKKIAKSAILDHGLVEVRVTIDGAGLRKERKSGEKYEIPWAAIERIECTAEGFCFISAGSLVSFVPIRAFRTSSDIERFNELCVLYSKQPSVGPAAGAEQGDRQAASVVNTSINLGDLSYHGAKRENRLASVSCGLGVASIALLPLLPLAVAIGSAAVATGMAARRRIKKSQVTLAGSASATWGMVLGAVSTLVAICLLILSVSIVSVVWGSIRQIITSAMPLAQSSNMVTGLINSAAIVQGCRQYAVGHDGRYPAHLSLLLITHACKPLQLCDPTSKTSALPESGLGVAESDWRTIADSVDASSDFVYVGDGLRLNPSGGPMDPDVIVAYGRDLYHGSGRIIAFADGNARFVPSADLAATFSKCNAARDKMGLPHIIMDVPLVRTTK